MKTLKIDKTALLHQNVVNKPESNLPDIDDATLIRLANSPFFQKKKQEAIETLSKISRSSHGNAEGKGL